MKRGLFILLVVVFLVACGDNSALSEDFKADVDQVLPIIEEARESQEEYSDQELDLLRSFSNKYEKGQYIPKNEDDYYEMNDIEKAILSEVNSMRIFAVELESEDEAIALASESSSDNEVDLYNTAEEELNELMKINNVEDLPEELRGKYPTYEIVDNLYPKQFEDDAKEIIDLYEPIVNGNETDVGNKEWYPLEEFLEQYQGEFTTFPTEYTQDGKYYLINGAMRDVIGTFNELKRDIDEGTLVYNTIDEFNKVKEELELFSGAPQ